MRRLANLSAGTRAHCSIALGALLASVGAALIYLPAGLLAAGGALVAWGLLVIDVSDKRGKR